MILQAVQRPKPNHRREPAGSSTRTERIWTDVDPGEHAISYHAVSKKLIRLFRHGRQVHREDEGATEFCRIKDDFQKHYLHCLHLSDDKCKKRMTGGGGNKKRHQYCTDSSGAILYLRALQGCSGRCLIDPTFGQNRLRSTAFCTIHAQSMEEISQYGVLGRYQN